MAAIGFVNGTVETGFVGQLKTLSIRAAIEIRANRSKSGDVQPDYRVYSEGVEIGAGWIRVGQVSGEPYVSLSLAAPEFGPRRLYANLGRAAGQDGADGSALICTPADCGGRPPRAASRRGVLACLEFRRGRLGYRRR